MLLVAPSRGPSTAPASPDSWAGCHDLPALPEQPISPWWFFHSRSQLLGQYSGDVVASTPSYTVRPWCITDRGMWFCAPPALLQDPAWVKLHEGIQSLA